MKLQKHIDFRLLQQVDRGGRTTFGMSQMWYPESFQRKAGCGSTAATNQILYLQRSGQIQLPMPLRNFEDRLNLLQTMWRYVTPSLIGVNRTDIYYHGMQRFIQEHQLPLGYSFLDVAGNMSPKTSIETIILFIAQGLDSNCPVAFLNLINKKQPILDHWHWTTIVAMEYESDFRQCVVTIFDGYQRFHLDLGKWLDGRMMGGGFVFLHS